MGPWEHCILHCMPTCHGILGIPDPEICTCGILGTLGCGTLGTQDPDMSSWRGTLGTLDPEMYTGRGTLETQDPEMYTWHGTLGTQDPEMYTWRGTLGTQDPEMYTWRGTLGTQDPEMYTWRGALRILDLEFLSWHMSAYRCVIQLHECQLQYTEYTVPIPVSNINFWLTHRLILTLITTLSRDILWDIIFWCPAFEETIFGDFSSESKMLSSLCARVLNCAEKCFPSTILLHLQYSWRATSRFHSSRSPSMHVGA